MGVLSLKRFGELQDTVRAARVEAPDVVTVRVEVVPGKGRGVIAARSIAAGERIELAPVVVIPAESRVDVEKTLIDHYVYEWSQGRLAIALGYGSIYNHSYTPNARYVKHDDTSALEYVALVDIPAGAEITVNYNGDPNDRSPLWFDVV
jgi:hypothetical protein